MTALTSYIRRLLARVVGSLRSSYQINSINNNTKNEKTMEKTYRITMSENLWHYCAHIGNGSIVKGLVSIVENYKAEDPDYATEAIAMQERINDASTQAPAQTVQTGSGSTTPLADVLADLDKESTDSAVEQGKVQVVEQGKATLHELSAYNMVLTGDTKPVKDRIAELGGKYQDSFNKLNGASGWRIPKSAIDKCGGVPQFIEMFAGTLTITVGDSLMTDEEREKEAERAKAKAEPSARGAQATQKESKPKAEKPSIAPTQAQIDSKPKTEPAKPAEPKPEPSMVCDLTNWNNAVLNVHLFDTDRTGKAIKSEGQVQVTPQSQWLYFRKNDKGKYLIYVHTGNNNLMMVGMTTCEIEKGAPLPQQKNTWETIGQVGLAQAIAQGMVKGAKPYQIEAYKAGGSNEQYLDWLNQHAA